MHNLCRKPAVKLNQKKVTAVKTIRPKRKITAVNNLHVMTTAAHPVWHVIPL